MTCPECLTEFEMIIDENGDPWPDYAEWWSNSIHQFLCSRKCWLQAQGELNG